jgi:hypothetical protein
LKSFGLHAVFHQIFSSRAVFLDRTGGGNVIGGHAVAGDDQHAGAFDRLNLSDRFGEIGEERRLLNVCAVWFKIEKLAAFDGDFVPVVVTVFDIGILLAEHLGIETLLDGLVDFSGAGPNFAEKHRLAISITADRLVHQIDIHRAGQGVRHHQWRAGEVIRFDIRIDPALEIAVAGENGTNHQIAALNRFGNRLRKRAAVANAGGASVSDSVKAEGIERFAEAGLVQIIGDHPAAGGERCLHIRRHAHAALHRFFRQQSGGNHHRWIARIGATGDGGDDDVAVRQLHPVIVDLQGCGFGLGANLLRVIRLALVFFVIHGGGAAGFIRPSIQPWCHALAHVFLEHIHQGRAK